MLNCKILYNVKVFRALVCFGKRLFYKNNLKLRISCTIRTERQQKTVRILKNRLIEVLYGDIMGIY